MKIKSILKLKEEYPHLYCDISKALNLDEFHRLVTMDPESTIDIEIRINDKVISANIYSTLVDNLDKAIDVRVEDRVREIMEDKEAIFRDIDHLVSGLNIFKSNYENE